MPSFIEGHSPQPEPFYRPFPESAAEAREGVIMGIEALPPEIIDDIVIHPHATETIPKELYSLYTPDFFAENIWMSVPLDRATRHILTAHSYGRVVPIGVGAIPFGPIPMLGRILTGKGSWLGGEYLEKIPNHQLIGLHHPGLLSVAGAEDDMMISTLLAKHGYRTAFHLAYAVLHPEKLKDWLMEQWQSPQYTNHKEVIEQSFAELAKDKQQPAYMWRIGGSIERYGDLIEKKVIRHRLRVEIAQSARLMLTETRMKNSYLAHLMPHADTQNALAALASHQPISLKQYEMLGHATNKIFAQNTYAFTQANKELARQHRGLSGFGLQFKDIDWAHFGYDYDTFAENYSSMMSPDMDREYYREAAAMAINKYLYRVAQYYLAPTPARQVEQMNKFLEQSFYDLTR
jgi:hypothetical protein